MPLLLQRGRVGVRVGVVVALVGLPCHFYSNRVTLPHRCDCHFSYKKVYDELT